MIGRCIAPTDHGAAATPSESRRPDAGSRDLAGGDWLSDWLHEWIRHSVRCAIHSERHSASPLTIHDCIEPAPRGDDASRAGEQDLESRSAGKMCSWEITLWPK